MLWVKTGTHIIDHERLLAAGAVARDLYHWGMLYAGKHETDGELPTIAILTSPWGAGMKANAKVADELVAVGLWERTETGFRISRWAEQGNETKASIEAKRAAARERKARHENEKVQRSERRTNAFSSTSTSTSDLDLRSEIASDPPPWWAATLDTIAMNTGVELQAGPSWLRYAGHRAGKSPPKPTSPADALYWLTTVDVRQVLEEREKLQHRADREAKWDKERREAPPKPFLVPVTPPAPYHGVNRKQDAEREAWAREAEGTREERAAAAKAAVAKLGFG